MSTYSWPGSSSGGGSGSDVNLIKVGGTAIALGQTTMSASLPVTLASNQSALAITASSLPLPTGAATSALQTTGNSTLTTINTTLGSPFQAGGSIGNTTFASTQSGTWNITNISGTISLPTGAATSALQTTGNSSLTTINTTLGSPFQAGGSIGNTTFASTQSGSWTVAATQSGTWTVQPGNTANTTPWLTTISQGGNSTTVTASNALKVDGSAVTQPVSGTVTANVGANTNGSFASFAVTTAAHTFSPPANAVGFVLESDSTNSTNVRWTIVSTPTSSSGMLMEPGRDTGYIPCGANVLVISVTGTNTVGIQWVLSS